MIIRFYITVNAELSVFIFARTINLHADITHKSMRKPTCYIFYFQSIAPANLFWNPHISARLLPYITLPVKTAAAQFAAFHPNYKRLSRPTNDPPIFTMWKFSEFVVCRNLPIIAESQLSKYVFSKTPPLQCFCEARAYKKEIKAALYVNNVSRNLYQSMILVIITNIINAAPCHPKNRKLSSTKHFFNTKIRWQLVNHQNTSVLHLYSILHFFPSNKIQLFQGFAKKLCSKHHLAVGLSLVKVAVIFISKSAAFLGAPLFSSICNESNISTHTMDLRLFGSFLLPYDGSQPVNI
jgi:hypothetical protein